MTSNAIGIGETQVWVVPLRAHPNSVSGCEHLLAADELARADRFITAELRERFILCRAALRKLLAESLNCDPQEILFRYETWGKPQLATRASPLHFNVSHSGDWGLIALSLSPVGVDLEVANKRVNFRAIASQVLSETEQREYELLPPGKQAETILHLWVCKEALLKALGLGIAEGLRKVTFALPIERGAAFAPCHIDPSLQLHLDDDGTCRMNAWIDAETWRVQLLDVLPASTTALATMGRSTHITVKEF